MAVTKGKAQTGYSWRVRWQVRPLSPTVAATRAQQRWWNGLALAPGGWRTAYEIAAVLAEGSVSWWPGYYPTRRRLHWWRLLLETGWIGARYCPGCGLDLWTNPGASRTEALALSPTGRLLPQVVLACDCAAPIQQHVPWTALRGEVRRGWRRVLWRRLQQGYTDTFWFSIVLLLLVNLMAEPFVRAIVMPSGFLSLWVIQMKHVPRWYVRAHRIALSGLFWFVLTRLVAVHVLGYR